jgi:hypothetical protein
LQASLKIYLDKIKLGYKYDNYEIENVRGEHGGGRQGLLGWMMVVAANSTVFRILVFIFKLNLWNFVIQHLSHVICWGFRSCNILNFKKIYIYFLCYVRNIEVVNFENNN